MPVPQATMVQTPPTSNRPPRKLHSWYDTDHGSAVRDWCNRRNIDTHPQRCKPRGSTTSRSLRIARDFSLGLQYHLFQTCLRSTAGHHDTSTHYGCSLKPTTSSARRRKRRNWLTGQSVSRIRRLQRISPPLTLCTIGGSSVFRSHQPSPPVPVPTQAEIIADLLHLPTSALRGGLNTWITAPVDEFPDLYPTYVAFIERLSGEESKGEIQYTQLSPGDFRRLSPTRQIAEFRTLGVDAHTDQEVLKILLGTAHPAPDETYALPTTSVAELPLLDILHHERHLGKHIRRVAERRDEAIRQVSRLTRVPGSSPSRDASFRETVASIQQLTRSPDDQRHLHLLLRNRRKRFLNNSVTGASSDNTHIPLFPLGVFSLQLL